MNIFQPKLFSSLRNYSKKQLVNDLVAGVIVAIIALPLSIALAIASGVSPEKGIYTAIVAGFVIAFLGGSNVNISGPTAAFATIVAGIVAQFGTSGLVIATLMAGLILILMGVFRFGSLIKYIPHTITTGFTSGIALTIVIGQIKDFLGLTFPEGMPTVETAEKVEAIAHSITTINWQAFLMGAIALAILIVWPKISKKIPGSLIAVVVGVVVVKVFDMEVNTVGDLYTISRDLPKFVLPEFSFNTVKQLIPSAFTIAILAGIESLLSCVVSDGMINDKHNSNTELIAQGVGNICSGLFGGIPATGAIARTAANVKNGGRTPVAGIVHALVLLLVLVVLMPYAAWIPMPVIAAILFMVAYNMCEWRQFVKICKTAPKSDIIALVVTFVLTVVFDLVVAIAVGMIIAVVLFMKRMADVTHIRTWTKGGENAPDSERLKEIPEHTTVIEFEGPMFFASSEKFNSITFEEGIKTVILRMRNVPALDSTAMRALNEIYSTCKKSDLTLILSHTNEQPLAVMKKAGFYDEVGEENFLPNIDEALAYAEKING
ncbi:MAG: sulfate permease [Clostridia bacterium]|nr:sulfate permease [Clostridia bacterium]MBR3817577.1 sulfate permease [Clostridia bacterium]